MTHSKRLIKYLAAFVFIFLCLLITPQSSIAETIIYGANSYGRTEMIEINLTQESSQKVGNTAFETQAMDQDPETGYIYYYEWRTTGNEFAYWDPVTGTNTIVRVYDVAPGIYAKQMAFAPDGTLYLMDNEDGLHTIDKYNGDLSFVGTLTGLEDGPYNRTGDMAFAPDGTLYVATYGSLYTVDIENMTATLLYADLIDVGGFSVWSGLAFCDGLLYASNLEELTSLSAIFSIDPSTGDVNLLFYTDTYLNDLTSCPANGIPPINQPPELGPIGAKTVEEGGLLEFRVTATDPDGDNLAYTAGNLPPGATFEPATQVFSWTPDYDQTGVYPNVLFTVTDDGDPAAGDSETITITVGDVNRPPVLDPIGDRSVNEGELLTVTVTATDPDGDNLAYTAGNLPSGATFDPTTQFFSWIPDYDQVGVYPDVLFTVIDDGNPLLSDSETITITVGDVNRPPVLDPIGDRSVTEGEELRFTVTASDSDGDNLTLSTGMLPSGASFYPVSGEFRWTPDYGQAGNYPVLFTVTDDGNPAESDSEQITITVNTSSTPIIVTLTGENDTEDTMIASGSYSSRNYGGSTADLAVGSYGNILRALINWNLSSIPTGSTIMRAEMSLYCHQDYTGGPITINAYRMLQPWVEGLLQDQDRMLDNPYSTSWLEYGYGEQWEGPGASGANDRDPSILALTTKSGTGWYVWDLTAAVQHWVDGDWINNGLILVSNSESGYNAKIFSPSEYQSEDLRPKLVIEYFQPINQPPELGPIGAKTVEEGGLLEFAVTATDPDGDNLAYTAGNLPSGATFDPNTQLFSWIPDYDQVGVYPDVLFTVTDDGNPAESDSEQITITVNTSSTPIIVTLTGENDTEDTMIASGSYSSRNYGGSTADLAVGSYGNILRALINWNLSSIPTGSTIMRAEMSLYCHQDYTGGPITINAYRMLQPWVEGLLQDQDRMLDNPYSTSWLEYGYGEQWEGPGASGANDRDPSILALTTKSGTGWYVWDLTAAVQHWVDGDWINNGLILVSNSESGYNAKIFSPSEYQSEDLRPQIGD